MAVNALTATGKTVGSPTFGQPNVGRFYLSTISLAVGSPSFGQPNLISLKVTALAVSSPVLGQPRFTILRTLTAVGKTVGSPSLGLPVVVRYVGTLSITVNSPTIGRPLLHRICNLTAAAQTIGAPVFGRPMLGSIGTYGLAVGSPVLDHPTLVRVITSNLPQPMGKTVGSPYLSDPLLTTIFREGGDMRGLPKEPDVATPYYREVNAIWPDLLNQRAIISPARNGVNRTNGTILQGWAHVEQSMFVIFATPFHERVLRRWVGSYVPYILGETYVRRIVTRFFWAIAVSIDLWEPNYRIKQVFYMGDALANWAPKTLDAVGEYRLGHGIFRTEGVYRPRAHLGDTEPYMQRAVALIGRGTEIWDPAIAQP
jgi:uncharacterized protein